MTHLENLFANNLRWAERQKVTDPDYFRKLSNQQKPKYLWIGCSDSRVSADVIVGLMPGEVFVHRNIANLVVHTDLNCLSVIQFAVEVLQVEHIIVCGHYGCGGVQAALDGQEHGLMEHWLQNIKDVHRYHLSQIEASGDHDAQMRRLCEFNVKEQVANVCHTPIVQKAWAKGKSLEVHGVIYSIENGILKYLGSPVSCSDDVAATHRLDY